MNLYVILLLLTLPTLVLVFMPLFSRRGNEPLGPGLEGDLRTRLEGRRDQLLRQLKELAQDQGGGIVTADEAALQRAAQEEELAEVLTALDRLGGDASAPVPPAPPRNKAKRRREAVSAQPESSAGEMATMTGWFRPLGLVMMLFMVLGAAGTYMVLGTPDAESAMAAALEEQRRGARDGMGAPDIQAMVKRLAERLEQEPDNVEGWLQLGRSQIVLGQTEEAGKVLDRVEQRWGQDTEILAAVARLRITSDHPDLMRRGVQTFEALLTRDPDNTEALWFLGQTAFIGGDAQRAVTLYDRLLATMATEDPNRSLVNDAREEALRATGTPAKP
ncbi:MAG: tetratricopeptide repeat protein [Magnetococcus sp. WYHC-3]